jgi:hypothetical protein
LFKSKQNNFLTDSCKANSLDVVKIKLMDPLIFFVANTFSFIKLEHPKILEDLFKNLISSCIIAMCKTKFVLTQWTSIIFSALIILRNQLRDFCLQNPSLILLSSTLILITLLKILFLPWLKSIIISSSVQPEINSSKEEKISLALSKYLQSQHNKLTALSNLKIVCSTSSFILIIVGNLILTFLLICNRKSLNMMNFQFSNLTYIFALLLSLVSTASLIEFSCLSGSRILKADNINLERTFLDGARWFFTLIIIKLL